MQRVAADELGMADEELEARVARLQALLPDLAQKLPSMRPQLVARLAAAVDDLPARLVQLKQVRRAGAGAASVCAALRCASPRRAACQWGCGWVVRAG